MNFAFVGNNTWPRPLRVVMALALALWIGTTRAADGRDFAATYSVTNITDLGPDVRLTLTLRVFNHSGGDITAGTVTLQNSLSAGADHGAFPDTLSLADREGTRIAADFTISREEYQSWQRGIPPSLRMDYTNSSGQTARRVIEISQLAGGEE